MALGTTDIVITKLDNGGHLNNTTDGITVGADTSNELARQVILMIVDKVKSHIATMADGDNDKLSITIAVYP